MKNLPTNWFRLTYADALAIGELSPANIAARYRTDAVQLFAWAATPCPQVPVRITPLMEGMLYPWFVLCRDFTRGLNIIAGCDVASLPYPEAVAVIAWVENEVKAIGAMFAELSEDLRTPEEQASQPDGYWKAVADEMEFRTLGIPPDADLFKWMEGVPLWRYFSIKLLNHKIAKSQRDGMRR